MLKSNAIKRIPVDREFAKMLKVRAGMENISVLELSRRDASRWERKNNEKPSKDLFFR